MGSLAAAAALARLGKSVLVLESHGQLGGLTHTFRRKQHRWGSGLHYTGWPTAYDCGFPGLWETLTEGQAPWTRLPEETDHYIRPDGEFVKRAGRERYRDDLHAAFPGERRAIDGYLDDIRRINQDFLRFMTLQALPPAVERLGPRWWLGRKFLAMDRMPLARYMDSIGASERLREHLWFTWGNFGGVPAETSVGSYAVPTEFLHDGLWTPARGSRSVAEAFAAVIRRAGGELRTRAEVTGLVLKAGRAAGVRVGDELIPARTVISGIGARETYRCLVPREHWPAHAARISGLPSSCSIFTVYLALDRTFLERHRLNGVNYWVEFEPGAMRGVWTDLTGPPGWLLLSLAPRFHQEHGAASDTVTAEVFVGVRGHQFARWQGSRVMKRGPEYEELKQRMADLTMARVEQAWPGFRASVRYAEGASPLTIASYTSHIHGAAYGIAPVPGRYSDRALRVHSGIPGLLLTGQDVSTAGIIGAFYGGLTAASALTRRDVARTLLHSRGRTAVS
jgi:phytoene dehydrogenase-like protein